MNKLYSTAIYIRLSKEDGDKEESDSVKNQKKLLSDYIEHQKDLLLYDLYIDDGYTGTNFHRPGFQKMLQAIKEGKINCVLVKDLSRFGRDYIGTGKYLERYFPSLGIRFISVTDQIDSLTQPYDMLLPIKNIFNEQYSRDISKKVQSAIRTKQKAGDFIGAFASYGYQKSSENKNKLVIDPYAAEIVRRIFFWFLQGYGKQEIAKKLNAEGILCPTEYKKSVGLHYKNPGSLSEIPTARWSYSTINHILHKEIYTGDMVQGIKHQAMRSRQKSQQPADWIIVKSTHEPIIDRHTWEKTQILLQKNASSRHHPGTPHIFSGFLRCGDCGRTMIKTSWRHADGSSGYSFCCGTYKRHGKSFCSPHTIPAQILEEIIRNDLNHLLETIPDITTLLPSPSSFLSSCDFLNKEQQRLQAAQRKIEYRMQSLYEDYQDSLLTKEEFLSYQNFYREKKQCYCQQLQQLQKQAAHSSSHDYFSNPWLDHLLHFRQIQKLDRIIISEMIENIFVYENHQILIQYTYKSK